MDGTGCGPCWQPPELRVAGKHIYKHDLMIYVLTDTRIRKGALDVENPRHASASAAVFFVKATS